VPWTVLGLASTVGLLAPGLTEQLAPWPFVVALAVFGMPHGAADWEVAARLVGRTGFFSRLIGFSGYLLLMAGSLALLLWQPGITSLLFLLLTVFHFGMADAESVGANDDGPVARWCLVLARGLLLLSCVFAADPARAWAPFAQIAASMPSAWHGAWQPDLDLLQRMAWAGIATGAMLAIVSAVARSQAGRRRDATLDLAEHALVAVMASTVDPLCAVGCFFLGVHAFRHTRRLACTSAIVEATDHRSPSHDTIVLRIIRVHLLSVPLMVPTVGCLVAICWWLGGFGVESLAVASIAFYVITTLPHHLLGLRLARPDLPPAAG
jgi:Brp/Blh family beta-carotene 15,15'-monooxygenase